MAEDTSGLSFDDRLLESNLTEKERALRDSFVSEYLKDFDAYRACLRMGFLPTFAAEWCKKLYNDSYVQQQIALMTRESRSETEPELKAAYESNLLYLMYNGTTTSRVAASKQYADFKGWTKPDANLDTEQNLIELFRGFAQKVPV